MSHRLTSQVRSDSASTAATPPVTTPGGCGAVLAHELPAAVSEACCCCCCCSMSPALSTCTEQHAHAGSSTGSEEARRPREASTCMRAHAAAAADLLTPRRLHLPLHALLRVPRPGVVAVADPGRVEGGACAAGLAARVAGRVVVGVLVLAAAAAAHDRVHRQVRVSKVAAKLARACMLRACCAANRRRTAAPRRPLQR